MKHLTIALLSIILFASIVNAQDQKRPVPPEKLEVSLSYSVFTVSQILEVVGVSFSEYEGTHFVGGIFAILRRNTAKNKFRYGITAGYDRVIGDFNDYYSSSTIVGSYRANHFTFAGEALWTYAKKQDVRIYFLLGAGYTYGHYNRINGTGKRSTDDINHFNFQLTPLGISAGKKIGGFIEFGLGYKGVINLGAYVKF